MNGIGAKIALSLVLVSTLYAYAQGQKASFPRPVWPNLDVPRRTSEFNIGWAPVNHVCGCLRSTYTPDNRHATLSLYEAEPQKVCCNDRKVVGHQETTERGFFDFGYVKPGRYWLVVNSDGADYAAPVSVDPRNAPVDCRDQILIRYRQDRSWAVGVGPWLNGIE